MNIDKRDSSAQYLRVREIPFTSHNNGAHLIIEGKTCYIDFWPGTGKWNCRSGKKGFGLRNLVEYCQTGVLTNCDANEQNHLS